MLNYTEKVWGLPCSKISAEWAVQRIKGLSISSIIKNILFKSKGPKTLVKQFYYARNGSGTIYETMINEAIKNGAKILFNSYPIKIKLKDDKVCKILIKYGKGEKNIKVKHLISSIPITEMIRLLDADENLLRIAKKLKFRSHLSLFITLKRERIFRDQWIYFPEKTIPFGRVMEPKNFSSALSPKNKTSLLLEFFCWYNDRIWKASKEELLDISMDVLEDIGFVKRNDVISAYVHKERYAYPVYEVGYEKKLNRVKEFLNTISNLQYVGRAGRFKYNNQDHAIEMGLLAARNLIEKRKYNLDEVGAEKEYFEKGYVK